MNTETKQPTAPAPTFDQMKAFLVERYKHERLYGRSGHGWGDDYGDVVVQSHLEDLRQLGYDVISKHEAANGRTTFVKFVDGELREQRETK